MQLAMRLTGFFMILLFLLLSVAGKTQSVSISGKALSLKTIFAIIKKQTETVFFYDEQLIREAKPVTIKLINAPLQIALNEIFKEQPLNWVLKAIRLRLQKDR